MDHTPCELNTILSQRSYTLVENLAIKIMQTLQGEISQIFADFAYMIKLFTTFSELKVILRINKRDFQLSRYCSRLFFTSNNILQKSNYLFKCFIR